jgi:uncharacterized protein with GYD domain
MRTYLLRVTYSATGTAGVLSDGGTARRKRIEQLITALGMTVEAWYYAFGEDDLIMIVKAPRDIEVAALNLRVGATGVAHIRTTVLLTPEEIDEAAKLEIDYRAPGALS